MKHLCKKSGCLHYARVLNIILTFNLKFTYISYNFVD